MPAEDKERGENALVLAKSAKIRSTPRYHVIASRHDIARSESAVRPHDGTHGENRKSP